jgi:hypothetical protein
MQRRLMQSNALPLQRDVRPFLIFDSVDLNVETVHLTQHVWRSYINPARAGVARVRAHNIGTAVQLLHVEPQWSVPLYDGE